MYFFQTGKLSFLDLHISSELLPYWSNVHGHVN